jgi:hypothetical protein
VAYAGASQFIGNNVIITLLILTELDVNEEFVFKFRMVCSLAGYGFAFFQS